MQQIKLVEVGPRDGFQNICDFIPTDTKKTIIDMIADAGVRDIMVTSFVSPKAIAQMKDATEIAQYSLSKYPDLNISALVPNMKGAERAIQAGLRKLTMVISVSELHNKANVNRTLDESFQELQQVTELRSDLEITLDLATVFGCPFRGEIEFDEVLTAVQRAYDIGIRRINICDTIGMAHPGQVRHYVKELIEKYPQIEFSIHIHDTRNMGIVNTLAAIESGITTVQAAIGGLGGCPFAPGASGNTSSEDLVYMLNRMGYNTQIDFNKLLKAARYTKEHINGNYSGHHIFIKEK